MNKAYNPSDVHPIYESAFNSGDIEAAIACYEAGGCFVARSGRVARGTAELREVYRITFASKPTIKVDVGKVMLAREDLALVIGEWISTAKTAEGRPEFCQARTLILSEAHVRLWL
jgi:ketosteroid isomerase-like protein